MCTFNGARFVGDQLASLDSQRRLPDELVVADDGSEDGTVELIRDFARAAPFPVRIDRNPARLGSTRNFEQVIRRADGDVIALSDQDDVWLPRKLEAFEARFASATRPGLVFGDALLVDEELHPLGSTTWQRRGFSAPSPGPWDQGAAFETLLAQRVVTGAAMAFRREYIPLVVPFPEVVTASSGWLIHDSWIAMLVAAVAPVAVVPEPVILYRQHREQQIGIPGGQPAHHPFSWSARLAAVRSVRGALPGEIRRMAVISERLREHDTTFDAARSLGHLEDRNVHFTARSTMPIARRARVSSAIGELRSGRYGRHSNGWRSALTDVIV
jgi:glycosyltransferase involved in cell wall biosynthesis